MDLQTSTWSLTATTLFSITSSCAGRKATTRPSHPAQSDPSTIGALMDMVDGNSEALTSFLSLDKSSTGELEKTVGSSRVHLTETGYLRLVRPDTGGDTGTPEISLAESETKYASQGIRPTEMKFAAGLLFFLLQIGAIVTFLVLFIKAQNGHGKFEDVARSLCPLML